MTNNRIYIIGAGAIGKALSVFLKLAQRDVVLIRGSVDDVSTHVENISVVLQDGSVLQADIEVSTLSNMERLNGIVILANKSFGNAKLAGLLKDKVNDSPLVVMQNGLNVEEAFINNGLRNIYRCVLFATSQSLASGQVRFKPVSYSLIGLIKGDGSDLQRVVQLLDNEIFHFSAVDNISPVIWKKAIANCVFNSICPLLDIDNGIFHRDEAAFAIAVRVINECVAIAKASGVAIEVQEIVDLVLLISKSSDGQLISTLQDIRNNRETEIDSLNFAIVKLATHLNLQHLVTETQILGELTKIKSLQIVI